MSISDYEGTATQKPHFDGTDKKRTIVFVGKIQVIENVPSKVNKVHNQGHRK